MASGREREGEGLGDVEEVLGWWCLEGESLVRDGMWDGQSPCVKHLPLGGDAGLVGAGAVERVSEDGMAQMGQMDAYLVGAARQDLDLEQRGLAVRGGGDELVEGDG